MPLSPAPLLPQFLFISLRDGPTVLVSVPCPPPPPVFIYLIRRSTVLVSVPCPPPPLVSIYLIKRSTVPSPPSTRVFIYLIRRSTVLAFTNCFLSTPLFIFQTHIFPCQWIFLFISLNTSNFTSVPVLCASADLRCIWNL